MAVPYGKRFPMEFDELFPHSAYVVGEVTAVRGYQSREDKARNRPVRPRIDEASGLPIFKVTIAALSAEKRAVTETSGKGTDARPGAPGSVDVRSAAA